MIFDFLKQNDIRIDELASKDTSTLLKEKGIKEGEVLYEGGQIFFVIWNRKSNYKLGLIDLVISYRDGQYTRKCTYNPSDIKGKPELIVPDYHKECFYMFKSGVILETIPFSSICSINENYRYLAHPSSLDAIYGKDCHSSRILAR
jgi:hypothetical protein